MIFMLYLSSQLFHDVTCSSLSEHSYLEVHKETFALELESNFACNWGDRNKQHRMFRTNKGEMKNLISQFLLCFLIVLVLVMRGRCSNLILTLSDNCTCVTSKGTYSLFPLRSRREGKPRFSIKDVPPHKGYTYTYNPCVPYNFTSSQGSCINVALCKYNTGGDPPDYINIGEQKEVQCEISPDGKIALVYPVHKYNPDVPGPVSKVTLECNNDSQSNPVFTLISEDNMTFKLKSHCGCIDGCLPGPRPTIPVSTGPTTLSNGTETPSSGPGDLDSYWELKILLPSLLGAFFVVVIFSVCLWRRLCIVQRALLCPCCHGHEQITVPSREKRIVDSTETSALITNQVDNRAVEHDFLGVKDKLHKPVQVEDGDLEGEYKFPEKDDRTVVA